jgi:RNA polymerase sigma-70 factor (ECF subfamily)
MTAQEFNKLVELHADGLYRFILKNSGNEAEAEDVVQDAFEKLWLNHEKIEFAKGKSWLFSAGYHTMIDHIRRSKKISYMEEHHENSQYTTESYTGTADMLQKAVDLLPAAQKSVLMLRDYEGYTYQEIAGITGFNEGQVKVYIHRARIFLRDKIEKMENYYASQQA